MKGKKLAQIKYNNEKKLQIYNNYINDDVILTTSTKDKKLLIYKFEYIYNYQCHLKTKNEDKFYCKYRKITKCNSVIYYKDNKNINYEKSILEHNGHDVDIKKINDILKLNNIKNIIKLRYKNKFNKAFDHFCSELDEKDLKIYEDLYDANLD